MFRFENIDYLWFLLGAIPIAGAFVFYYIWRGKALTKFGTRSLVLQLVPDLSNSRHIIKFILLFFAYIFIIIGFANPQVGTRQEKVKRNGIDVIIALDVSNSMMSQDVKPSRLDRAKNFISNFIDNLDNDRLGIVVFAGKAYMQMPLTADYSAARMYLRTINPGMIPTQGTNLGEAIGLAQEGFVKGETGHKALIIITDGEDNEGGVEEKIDAATKTGVRIFTVGVGSENGSPIPMENNFKRDESGNIVLSKLNVEMLKKVAGAGNGQFLMLGSGKDEVSALLNDLKGIKGKDFEEMVFTDFDDQFQWCLGIAAILLLVEWWLSERKSKLSLNF